MNSRSAHSLFQLHVAVWPELSTPPRSRLTNQPTELLSFPTAMLQEAQQLWMDRISHLNWSIAYIWLMVCRVRNYNYCYCEYNCISRRTDNEQLPTPPLWILFIDAVEIDWRKRHLCHSLIHFTEIYYEALTMYSKWIVVVRWWPELDRLCNEWTSFRLSSDLTNV